MKRTSEYLIRRLLVLLLCAATWPSVVMAALVTELEPRVVDELETVRLTIRAEGTLRNEAPDFSPLTEDFEILGNQASSRIQSINGRTRASVEYQLRLRPRRTGEIVIPSLLVGQERTESLRLVVRPIDPLVRRRIEALVFFETELSADPVYVQAETVFTRRLFYSQGVQIYSDLPGAPDVENAVVIPLGETKSRSVLRGGRRYGVIEQRFALFPEASGEMVIPAISVTASVRLQSGGRTRRSGIRVGTEPLTVRVDPIPDTFPDQASWLPATSVDAVASWSPTVRRFEVGEPITLTVEVRTTGNRGSAIPPLHPPLPESHFKIYPDPPAIDESARGDTVTGIRRVRYALIPTVPGPLDLPSLTLPWWDTQSHQLRTATLDLGRIEVFGVPTRTEIRDEPPQPLPESEDDPVRPATLALMDLPWAALTTILLIVTGLGTVALIALNRLRQSGASLPEVPLVSHLLEDRRRRQLERALVDATRHAPVAEYRRLLTAYLAAAYEEHPAAAMRRFRQDPQAEQLVRSLDAAIYAAPALKEPDRDALTRLARSVVRNREADTGREALPALYS